MRVKAEMSCASNPQNGNGGLTEGGRLRLREQACRVKQADTRAILSDKLHNDVIASKTALDLANTVLEDVSLGLGSLSLVQAASRLAEALTQTTNLLAIYNADVASGASADVIQQANTSYTNSLALYNSALAYYNSLSSPAALSLSLSNATEAVNLAQAKFKSASDALSANSLPKCCPVNKEIIYYSTPTLNKCVSTTFMQNRIQQLLSQRNFGSSTAFIQKIEQDTLLCATGNPFYNPVVVELCPRTPDPHAPPVTRCIREKNQKY